VDPGLAMIGEGLDGNILLFNNTMIDVLDDKDNHSFGKMTNAMWCDRDQLVWRKRVLVCEEEVSTVVMVVWMVWVYSSSQ
jgi:hypothetical protein